MFQRIDDEMQMIREVNMKSNKNGGPFFDTPEAR